MLPDDDDSEEVEEDLVEELVRFLPPCLFRLAARCGCFPAVLSFVASSPAAPVGFTSARTAALPEGLVLDVSGLLERLSRLGGGPRTMVIQYI